MGLFAGDSSNQPVQLAKLKNKWFRAIKQGNLQRIKELHKQGFNIDTRNDRGWTGLMVGLRHAPNSGVVDYLLEKGANVKARTQSQGITPLMIASGHSNHSNRIKRLLERGADINSRTRKNRLTLLMFAVSKNGNEAIVQTLLEAGADTGVQTKRTKGSALMMAASNNINPEIVEVLIEAGLDVQRRSEDGVTPLLAATLKNSSDSVV